MKKSLQKFILYARLPEMRLFWFFLPFLMILLGINIFYLPSFWTLISAAVFLILTTLIAVNGLRLVRSNLEVKIERNELGSIISNLRDGIIAYDSNFKILIFNRAAEVIFNLPAGEVMGQTLAPERAKDPRFTLLTQVIFPSLAPLVVRRSDPNTFPQVADLSFVETELELRVTTDRIIDPNGVLLGFVKLIHDRTRELGLLRSKTEFISVAAYQLRTPLAAVHWSFESLVKESLTDSQKELANAGLGAARKLLRTVNDLLDVSKIEEGRFGYQFENVEIINFVEGVISEMKEAAEQSGIKIYYKKPAEASIAVSLDPQKIKMVLFNILDNALRYNIQNGEVVVAVERLSGQPFVQVSVKDTGVGIPAGEMKKLFGKFFRAENVVKMVPEGSGLGLNIAKNIIKRHGGQIWAESEIGRGSTFYFTIPTDPSLIPPKEVVYGEE
jgi:signal transduction histidine kinase